MARSAPTSSPLEAQRLLLTATALYDGVLGLVFLVLFRPLLGLLGVAVPENPIYLQLAAGCIALFGLGFWHAAQHPVRNLDLVRLGVGMKVFYVALAVYAAAVGLLPHPLFLVLALLDALFVVGVVVLWRDMPKPRD